jgi:hypothetical protein
MRTVHSDHHLIYLQSRDLGHAKAAAAGQANDHQVTLRVGGSLSSWRQIGQDSGQLTASK